MATKFITVSINIMHDTNLNQSQKFIYAEIEQLSMLDNGCTASNNHFSKLIGVTKENVSRNIQALKNKGYIDVEIISGSRNHTRIITLTKIVRPPYQSSKTPLSKQQETKENKTINKTINSQDASKSIYEYYKSNIKASNSKQQCINNISKWLKEFNNQELITAIDNYLPVSKSMSDAKYIKDCKNFFGVAKESNGFFKDYLVAKEIEPTLPNGQPIPSWMK